MTSGPAPRRRGGTCFGCGRDSISTSLTWHAADVNILAHELPALLQEREENNDPLHCDFRVFVVDGISYVAKVTEDNVQP